MGTGTHGGFACWKRDVPEDRRRIARRAIGHLRVFLTLANWIGAELVFVYFAWVFPHDEHPGAFGTTSVNALVGGTYVVLAAALGIWAGERRSHALKRWRVDDAPPTEAEARELMNVPKRCARDSAICWAVAVPLFSLLNLGDGVAFAADIAFAIVVAGLASITAVYLVAERITRPALAYVLDPRATDLSRTLGVAPRIVITWALLSGVPLIGIASIPLGRLPDRPGDLALPIAFVVGVALVIGFLGMKAVAHAIARPVRSLRDAMDAVGEGRTDVEVQVDDASEIGRLQAGFNAMVDGLRERERLRELFGRQVGDDVAREALERGVTLGGQQKTVAVLFVDIIGSTELASQERPERVVELLNGFFAVVVETVAKHGGLVNKFEGDGAVCVFGAPVDHDEFAGAALTAARELRDRLLRESPVDFAIGVSCGMAVAGHVGAEERYEYTVIGDPVNEAARLRELAKSRPERVLASAATVESAGDPEAARWRIDGQARLRGRSEPTRLAFPHDVAGAAAVGAGTRVGAA
jgi:adenylate cyclase